MSVGIRVFEIAAVGKLSIRPSRLASEDLPELDSPQMARRSGRSRRCCVRRNARTAGNSFEPGGIALSSMFRASFSSARIRPVSGWSDTTGTSSGGLTWQAPSNYQGNATRAMADVTFAPIRCSKKPERSATGMRAAGRVTPSFLCCVGSSLGSSGRCWRSLSPGGRRYRCGSRRNADRRVRYALGLPEARQMTLDDAVILAAFAQLLERAVHIVQDGTRMRMRLGDQHMKGRERDRLLDHAHLVGKPERGDARAPRQLRLHHAIDGRGVEQAEALIDRRRPHQDDLVVAHPAPPVIVKLVHRLPGGNA